MSTQADILPHPDGTGWLVAWQTERMAEPALWLYPTQAEAEQVAATFRGENVTPLPAPPEPEPGELDPPSPATVLAIHRAAEDADLVDVVFGPAVPGTDPWVSAEDEARWAAEDAQRAAERAGGGDLIADFYSGRYRAKLTHRKRRRRAGESDPLQGESRERYTAAFFREVNRLHLSGVLTRAETRQLLGLDPQTDDVGADPWWRRLGRTA